LQKQEAHLSPGLSKRDKKEKMALEKKLTEMEEELKVLNMETIMSILNHLKIYFYVTF